MAVVRAQFQLRIVETARQRIAVCGQRRSDRAHDHGFARRSGNHESADAYLIAALGENASGNVEQLNVRRRRHRHWRDGIERGEKPAAGKLPNDRGLVFAPIIIRRDTTERRHTTIRISRDAASFAVHRDVVKVEKISIVTTEDTEQTNGSFLHRIAGSGVHRHPVRAAIISGGDIKIPNALERRLVLVIAASGAAEETKRGTIPVAGDHCGKDRALDPARRVLIARRATNRNAYFEIVAPGLAMIGGDRDMRPAVAIHISKVNRVIGADTYRRIAGADTVRHGFVDPSKAVVARDSYSLATRASAA